MFSGQRVLYKDTKPHTFSSVQWLQMLERDMKRQSSLPGFLTLCISSSTKFSVKSLDILFRCHCLHPLTL